MEEPKTSVQPAIRSFPSIGDLFAQSWEVFKRSLLSLFIYYVILLVISIVFFAIILGIGAISFGGILFAGNNTNIFSSFFANPTSVFMLVFLVIASIVGSIIINLILQAGPMLIFTTPDGKVSIGDVLKKSFSLVTPLFLINLLIGLLAFGGFFVFVIPALLFNLFFLFAPYEIVLENQGVIAALKRSYAIVSQNFWSVLGRILLIGLVSLGANIVMFLVSSASLLIPFLGILLIIGIYLGGFAVGWYVLAYMFTLYKQAKTVTVAPEKSSLTWVWIVSILGWVIGVLVVVATFSLIMAAVKSEALKRAINEANKSKNLQQNYQFDQNSLKNLIPSLSPFPTISGTYKYQYQYQQKSQTNLQ